MNARRHQSPALSHQTRMARRGVTLVESTIVLGTFLVMMLGILDLALVVLRQNSLDAAGREVARSAIVRGDLASTAQISWGPTRYASRVSRPTEIATIAREKLVTMDPHLVFITVDWPDGGHQLGERVRVRLAYRHTAIFPMLYGRHLDLRSQCVMRIAH